MKQARFIVLDGVDGTGKDTQAARLVALALERGLSALGLSYPIYDSHTGRDIGAYQQGEYGELAFVDPHLASYLYAVNRFEHQTRLQQALTRNDLVIAARYVPSNVAYMAARVPNTQKVNFRAWLERLDYEILGNPKEDAVIFLDLPIDLSNRLIAKRALGRRDINDENHQYRESVRKEYLALAKTQPHWHVIDCALGSKIRSIQEIATEIGALVFDRLMS
ncbi:hypothetical protein HY524_01120 [Candidatus Berkelbacteria bacterium]|nr:hypothetical protein [Candidatus Berkelbacteria bacterium]